MICTCRDPALRWRGLVDDFPCDEAFDRQMLCLEEVSVERLTDALREDLRIELALATRGVTEDPLVLTPAIAE